MEQSFPPEEQEKLQKARVLIQQKQYRAAYDTLKTIPHNPVARQWGKKLVQILQQSAPVVSSGQPSVGQSSAVSPGQPLPQADSRRTASVNQPEQRQKSDSHSYKNTVDEAVMKHIKPTDPRSFSFLWVIFMPAALFMYIQNWKNLGKPQWRIPTFIGGILVVFLTIGMMLLGAALSDISEPLGMGLAGGATITLGYWMALDYLQRQAYNFWTETEDKKALVNYPYNLERAGLIVGGITVAFMLAFGGYAFFFMKPTAFENQYFTLEYSHRWHTIPQQEAAYCEVYGEDCLLVIESQSGSVAMGFAIFPMQIRGTLEVAEADLWQRYTARYPGVTLKERKTRTIGNVNAVVREFTFPREAEAPLYIQVYYVMYYDSWIEIMAWGEIDTFEEGRDEIEKVVQSMNFKTSRPEI